MRMKRISTILVPQPLSHLLPELREYTGSIPAIGRGFAHPTIPPNLKNGICTPDSAAFLQQGFFQFGGVRFWLRQILFHL